MKEFFFFFTLGPLEYRGHQFEGDEGFLAVLPLSFFWRCTHGHICSMARKYLLRR